MKFLGRCYLDVANFDLVKLHKLVFAMLKVMVQAVAFCFLWSLDAEAVLTALSLFAALREQTDIVGNHGDIRIDYLVYCHMSNAKNILTAGT